MLKRLAKNLCLLPLAKKSVRHSLAGKLLGAEYQVTQAQAMQPLHEEA